MNRISIYLRLVFFWGLSNMLWTNTLFIWLSLPRWFNEVKATIRAWSQETVSNSLLRLFFHVRWLARCLFTRPILIAAIFFYHNHLHHHLITKSEHHIVPFYLFVIIVCSQQCHTSTFIIIRIKLPFIPTIKSHKTVVFARVVFFSHSLNYITFTIMSLFSGLFFSRRTYSETGYHIYNKKSESRTVNWFLMDSFIRYIQVNTFAIWKKNTILNRHC